MRDSARKRAAASGSGRRSFAELQRFGPHGSQASEMPGWQSGSMTNPQGNMTMSEYQQRAEQAIADFDVADGLELSVQIHQKGPGYLELYGRTRLEDGIHAFAYRASRTDLEDHGDSWFLRRAMRSLNDQYAAGHLPMKEGETAHQVLRPPSEYRLPEADPEVNGPQSEDTLASLDSDA
jgi:hypothetical protein